MFFVNSWIIIHFGKNPVNGGRPPRDKRVIRDEIAIMGALFQVRDRDRVEVVEVKINSINIEEVIKI